MADKRVEFSDELLYFHEFDDIVSFQSIRSSHSLYPETIVF